MVQLPRTEDFSSPVHDTKVVARVGVWLGAAFATCFLTGLVSHLHQHPLAWLPLPVTPEWGYRLTQGLHVAAGMASVPLLLAKLYAVYPRLFRRPVLGTVGQQLRRASVAVLVAAAVLQVFTGVANVAQWYVFGFGFTAVHYAIAWVVVGALLVHVAVFLPVIGRALGEDLSTPDEERRPVEVAGSARGRRWFLGSALGVAAGAVVLTVGQTVPALEPLALLARRHPARSPSGIPVNRTAAQAGITASTVAAVPGRWRMRLSGPGGERRLSYTELAALPQTEVELPITCVEGWSASGRWAGVRVRDLVALAGGSSRSFVGVESLERRGAYRRTTLPTAHAQHPDTLLALRLNGAPLSVDHGYPARLIAPNRPGVLQAKWVSAMVVSA
jgi:DMSO/TMAO reductase YedYZ molybdopterin-dependent catalytic subunit